MSDQPTLSPDLERRIARAEAAIAVIKPKFQTALVQDLARLGAQADAGGAPENLRALVHDIKGNAGGFGFSLVSDIAACLTAYLDAIAGVGVQDAEVVRNHCNSMAIAATEPLNAEERQRIEEFIRLSQQLTTDVRDHF